MTDHAPVVALLAVGLTPRLLEHMPALQALERDGFRAGLEPVLPAVTCSVQSTFLTGRTPQEHGVVGNGWFFRDLGEVLFWRQSHGLVQGEPLWTAARRARPGFTVANLCWWYAMGAATDLTLTPRPVYHADGRKSPDCYTRPPALHDELTAELGTFPLFQYWGPTASIRSTQWIAGAATRVLERHRPDLSLVYLPHLDYDLQRYGPDSPQAVQAARDLDRVAGSLIASARTAGARVVVLSEYGITGVRRSVALNRVLRSAGLLEVYTQAGMEYLDPWTSRAFAVVDHQIAHVYVRDSADRARVRDLLAELPGVGRVLVGPERSEIALDHERSGDLVVLAEPDSWFSYYYWLDDARAPDFARTVEIHRKPGYDPAELLLDPADRFVKPRIAATLARRRLGMRGTLDVVPLHGDLVRGSHGLAPADPADGPVLLCSEPGLARATVPATDVRELLLQLCGAAGA
jgi:predicted AlkP superfamily pyrophosphatase or phosphodiesterase